jgi:hypothetical protein
MNKVKRISYAAWLVKYMPIVNDLNADAPYDGYMFETYGKELDTVHRIRGIAPRTVWTLIDTGRRRLTISSGFHFVNRLGYFLTEKPCTDDFVDVSA